MHEVADHCISRQLSENDIQEVFETYLRYMRFEYESLSDSEYDFLDDWEELAVESAYCIGIMILNGVSDKRTNGLAHIFLREAAQRGLAMAQFSLGKLYLGGVSVKQSYSRALKWLTRAEQQGISQAKSLIEEINAIDEELRELDFDREQMLESICIEEENGYAYYREPVQITLMDGTQIDGLKMTGSSASRVTSYDLRSYESVEKAFTAIMINEWDDDYENIEERSYESSSFDGFFDSDENRIDEDSVIMASPNGDKQVIDFDHGYRYFSTIYWVYKNGMRKEIDEEYIKESLDPQHDSGISLVLDDEIETLYEMLESYSKAGNNH